MTLRAYFNGKAAVWDENIAERDTNKLERMSERLKISPGSTVLDVGTGTGVFLPFLLNQLGERGKIIATDIADSMLARARTKGFNGDIDFLQADVASLPLSDRVVDAVVCYSSFPHFQDKPKAINEMKRVLKGGGRLLICHTSSRTEINQVHRQIPVVSNDLLPDGAEMESLLSAAGFTEIKIEDSSDDYLASAEKSV